MSRVLNWVVSVWTLLDARRRPALAQWHPCGCGWGPVWWWRRGPRVRREGRWFARGWCPRWTVGEKAWRGGGHLPLMVAFDGVLAFGSGRWGTTWLLWVHMESYV